MARNLYWIILLALQLATIESSWIIEQVPRRFQERKPRLNPKRRNNEYNQNIWKYQALAQTDDQSRGKDRRHNDVVDVTEERTHTTQNCASITTFSPYQGIPCDLPKTQTPMFVYFSFDDAITSWNVKFYHQLFSTARSNPNGCPIRATFFNSHDNTEYDFLKELYDAGHEISSHSVSHRGPSTWWSDNATKSDWHDEIVGQRENIHRKTAALRGRGIPLDEIRGMRAPFLSIGGDDQFDMLEENDFMYDASISNHNEEPSWPFTLHDPSTMNGPICRSVHCPSRPHDVWEAIMNVYYMNTSGSAFACSMIDGCRPRESHKGALDFLRANFDRHRNNTNKVPFGINMHAAWFAFDGYMEAMEDFLDEILDYDDVFILPIYQLLNWMKQPVSLNSLTNSQFGCSES